MKFLRVLLPLIIFMVFITKSVDLPFVGTNATSNNIFSLAAKNYIKFGYFNTKFAPVISVNKNLSEEKTYYINHPPLLPLFESFLFRIFGEHYWVGRLTAILPAVGSLLLVYFLALRLGDQNYAFISALLYALLPASPVFGRMIALEPLTMFFVLSVLNLLVSYFKKKEKKYFYWILLFSIPGVLSDWPMVYFLFFICIYLFYSKRRNEAIILFLTTLLLEISFLIYASSLYGGISTLITGIVNRSYGIELVSIHLWFIKWIGVLLIRFIVYFNPIFCLFSLLYLIKLSAEIKESGKLNLKNFIFLTLFLQGFLYVVLFPNGSFGHAFWIYYFIPYFSLSAGYYLTKIWLFNRFLCLSVLIFAFVYLFFIAEWKNNENLSNLWRYDLSVASSDFIEPYTKVLINPGTVIDPDLLEYQYSVKTVLDVTSDNSNFSGSSAYFYSCYIKCGGSEKLDYLMKRYDRVSLESIPAELFIFNLKEVKEPKETKHLFVDVTSKDYKTGFVKKIYSYIKILLSAPQI